MNNCPCCGRKKSHYRMTRVGDLAPGTTCWRIIPNALRRDFDRPHPTGFVIEAEVISRMNGGQTLMRSGRGSVFRNKKVVAQDDLQVWVKV